MKKATERDIQDAVARIRALNPNQALLGRLCAEEAARLGVRTRVIVRRFPTVSALWDDTKQATAGLVPEGMSGGMRVEHGQRVVTIPVTDENHRNLQERWEAMRNPAPPVEAVVVEERHEERHEEEVPEVPSATPEPRPRGRMLGGRGMLMAMLVAATAGAGGDDVVVP